MQSGPLAAPRSLAAFVRSPALLESPPRGAFRTCLRRMTFSSRQFAARSKPSPSRASRLLRRAVVECRVGAAAERHTRENACQNAKPLIEVPAEARMEATLFREQWRRRSARSKG